MGDFSDVGSMEVWYLVPRTEHPFLNKDNKFVIIIDSQEGEIYILLSIKRIILAHPAHFPLLHHHFIQQHALSRVVSRFVTGKERRELAEARAPLCYQRGGSALEGRCILQS
jgi:hypothetical protein